MHTLVDFKIWLKDIQHLSSIDFRWLLIWILIYLSFILLDILMPHFPGTALLKYVGIFLCVIYAYQKYHSDSMLILADTILVWTPYEVAGVYVFCIAQLLHFLRLTNTKPEIFAAYAAAISLFFAFAIVQGLYPIYAICIVYAMLLIGNFVLSRRRYSIQKKDYRARCCYYAFIAFLCCDICVATRHLMFDGLIPMQNLELVAFLVWVFYYPSQVLMANSSTLEMSHRPHKDSRRVAKTHPTG